MKENAGAASSVSRDGLPDQEKVLLFLLEKMLFTLATG